MAFAWGLLDWVLCKENLWEEEDDLEPLDADITNMIECD